MVAPRHFSEISFSDRPRVLNSPRRNSKNTSLTAKNSPSRSEASGVTGDWWRVQMLLQKLRVTRYPLLAGASVQEATRQRYRRPHTKAISSAIDRISSKRLRLEPGLRHHSFFDIINKITEFYTSNHSNRGHCAFSFIFTELTSAGFHIKRGLTRLRAVGRASID